MDVWVLLSLRKLSSRLYEIHSFLKSLTLFCCMKEIIIIVSDFLKAHVFE